MTARGSNTTENSTTSALKEVTVRRASIRESPERRAASRDLQGPEPERPASLSGGCRRCYRSVQSAPGKFASSSRNGGCGRRDALLLKPGPAQDHCCTTRRPNRGTSEYADTASHRVATQRVPTTVAESNLALAVFNLLALIWLVSGILGRGIGAGLGVTWFFGFVVLSLVWLVSRPSHRECPRCGSDVEEGLTVCPSCGFDVSGPRPRIPGHQRFCRDAEQAGPSAMDGERCTTLRRPRALSLLGISAS